MRRLRVGCIGTGFIAGRHLSALAGFPDVEVVAVADTVPERAADVAARYGGRCYDDGLALLASEELDAVWLCVPPFAHGPLEEAALDRDLPFFVEKPLALDLDTALRIAGRVQDQGLLTGVGYHWRHLDVVERAAEVLREAPAQLVTGYWLDKTPAVPWWTRRERSGGQVLEQTTHIFDLVRVLVGEVDAVHAIEVMSAREHPAGADVPTVASATLHFSSGAIGTVSSTCVLGWRHRVGLHLMSEGQVVEVSEQGLSEHQLRVVTADGEQVTTSEQDPITAEDRDFVDALCARSDGRAAAVRAPYEDAVRSHALAWAADRSAREGMPVRPMAEVLHG